MLHRQHHTTAVGYRIGILSGLRRKLEYIWHGKGNAISQQLQAFLQVYGGELSEEYRRELAGYLAGLGSFSQREKYLRHSQVYRQKRSEDWKFRILYLMGKYDL